MVNEHYGTGVWMVLVCAGRVSVRAERVGQAMIRTVQWDEEARRWFYYCSEKRQYVRLWDAEDNEVTEPPTEEKEHDERIPESG